MAWISLICLLALSSSAFGRAAYGGYSAPLTAPVMRDLPTVPTESFSGYSEPIQRDIPVEKPITSGYGSSYGSPRKMIVQADQTFGRPMQSRVFPSQQQLLFEQQELLQKKIQESTILSEADILCRGQRTDTVIPLEGGRRFVVCLDESKGYEQFCPKGLLYHTETRRCERKLGPLENVCASQPCLNNGKCIPTDGSYRCECPTGFDGRICELDATVCHTQQPCGSTYETRCQSFRWGAALTHMCILQGGRSYGLTSSQVHSSPCKGIDGTFPLAFSDKGFIMCDGESMFVESCPGGTIWDDMNKACVWPDMEGVIGVSYESTPKVTYESTPRISFDTPKVSSYGYSTPSRPVVLEQPKLIQTFREAPVKQYSAPTVQKTLFPSQDELPVNSYGAKTEFTLPQQDRVEPVSYSSYSAPAPMMKSIRQHDMRLPSNGY